MITIYSKTPDELIRSLKDYFLITDHFVILSCVEEIDAHVEDWISIYNGYVDRSKCRICFNLPFLAVSNNRNVIIELVSSFDCVVLNEINNILEDGIKFINRGFLPLSTQSIIYYIDNVLLPVDHNLTVQSAVFSIFKRLGYLTSNLEPTSRLINTLNENDEYVKYANALTINISNELISKDSKEYKTLLFEVLKLIDYVVHVSADMALNNETSSTTDETVDNDNSTHEIHEIHETHETQ